MVKAQVNPENEVVDRKMKQIFDFKRSPLHSTAIPLLVCSVWAIVWTIVFQLTSAKLDISQTLIGVLGTVLSLLLGFRTNTAYDRYWEGRKLWSVLHTQIRNLSRLINLGIISKTDNDEQTKNSALLLLQAYAVSVKRYLRNETGVNYDDFNGILCFEPEDAGSIPFEIMFQLQGYIYETRKKDLMDNTQEGQMLGVASAMIETLSNFERVRYTPIPLAYHIHVRHTLMIYLLSLPFQLAKSQGWFTIPIIIIASFTMLGIEAIGGEIENPFGYDLNDLNSDDFCDHMKRELTFICDKKRVAFDRVKQWTRLHVLSIGAKDESEVFQLGDLKSSVDIRRSKSLARVKSGESAVGQGRADAGAADVVSPALSRHSRTSIEIRI